MISVIPKRWHYALPFLPWLWWNKKVFTWRVEFPNSCRYDIGDPDQLDTNKLCGIGYLPGGHHIDSARFGWRYNKEKDGIDLLAYCYVQGKREIIPITTIPFNTPYTLQLTVNFGSYFFKVVHESGYKLGAVAVAFFHKRKLQYKLPVYFGGNRTAPHWMKINIKKV